MEKLIQEVCKMLLKGLHHRLCGLLEQASIRNRKHGLDIF